MNKSPKDQINEASLHLPQQMVVIESGVDPDMLQEYFEQSGYVAEHDESIKSGKFDFQRLKDNLFAEAGLENQKKMILITMAHMGNIKAYRTLEEYVKTATDDHLKKWALLALQECRMSVESELSDETQGYILSGLGGKNNKLRYFFTVVAHKESQLTDFQHNLITLEVQTLCKKYHADIEEVHYAPQYVSVLVLVPLDVAIGQIIEETIEQCNVMGNFLMPQFLVTNVLIPNNEMIDELVTDLQNNPNQTDEKTEADNGLS